MAGGRAGTGGVLRALVARATGGEHRQRGLVEAGVVVSAVGLIAAAAVGSGVAATVVSMSDGMTWLDEDGQVLQLNSATGAVDRRLQVAPAGTDLAVVQHDGRLLVEEAGTGRVTSIDLATLVAAGQRVVTDEHEVLVGGGFAFLVRAGGLVRAVDPLTLADLGEPLRTGEIADAAVDDAGTIWLAGADGVLREVRWTGAAFVVERSETLAGTGPGTRLTPHDVGVTVFGPAGGTVAQVGTSREVAHASPGLTGDVLQADRSPARLAAAAVPDGGRVLLVSRGDLVEVGVGALGCDDPGRPAVLETRVYVPCTGTGRVLVLAADGTRAAPDVVVPGGRDPELLVDDGRLVVRSEQPGAVVLVEADGSTRQVTTAGGAVVDVTRPGGSATVAPPPQRERADRGQPVRGRDAGHDRGTRAEPDRRGRGGLLPVPGSRPGTGDGRAGQPVGGPGGAGTGPASGTPGTARPTTPGPEVTDEPTTPVDDVDPDEVEPEPEPEPGPAVPVVVTDLVAGLVDEDRTVLVGWTAAASGADTYVVVPEGGAGTAVPGDRTSVRLEGLAPGPVRVVVQTVLGDLTATSAPSNQVTVLGPVPEPPGRPPVPAGLGSYERRVEVDEKQVGPGTAEACGRGVHAYTSRTDEDWEGSCSILRYDGGGQPIYVGVVRRYETRTYQREVEWVELEARAVALPATADRRFCHETGAGHVDAGPWNGWTCDGAGGRWRLTLTRGEWQVQGA